MRTNVTRLDDKRPRHSLPCSQSQKRFWFESQLHADDPGLNVAVRWRVEGTIGNAQLEQAWRLIIARHQTLRTSFAAIDGEPHQIVEPSVPFHVPVVDLSGLGEREAVAEAERVAAIEAKRTFDITVAPLIRVTHVRVRPDVSMILVTAHHAVCDGWSVGVLAREMGQICAALAAGRSPELPELTRTYADYAAWERETMSASLALASARDDVKRNLRGFSQFEILPDEPRPQFQTTNSEIVSLLLDRSLTGALASLARANNCTLFMVAYAALLVLLYRHSGDHDISIGTQIAGREEVEFEQLVGTFINTLPLRTDVSGDPTFRELLARASDTVADAFELRHVPLEEIVEIVNPKRDLSRNALFSVNFVFQRSFIENATYGSFRLIDMPSRSAGPICDLNFFMVERPDGWRASCEFNTDLYQRSTVERMLTRFVRLLHAVTQNPGAPISTLPMMEEDQRAAVIALGTGETLTYDRDETIHAIFARIAARTPSAVAVVDGSAELTYETLERKSNQVAHYLRTQGVGPESAVGVALERSADIAVILLGILKAGGAYVPLDTSEGFAQTPFLVENSGAKLIVTDAATLPRVRGAHCNVVDLADAAPSIAIQSSTPPARGGRSDGLACITYTAGMVGYPVGVALTHRGILRLICPSEAGAVETSDVTLHHTPLAFDVANFAIWAALLNGARVAMAQPGDLGIAAIEAAIERFGVTTLFLSGEFFREAALRSGRAYRRLRTLLTGGDFVSSASAKRFLQDFPNCRLVNCFGTTENTTFSCAYTVASTDAVSQTVPIGRPLANSSAYVLDERLAVVPPGVVGELCVGGDGVARGYVKLPELTAERFVPDPFSADPAARLFRTRSWVRQRDDGVIEFLGRFDRQVKIKSYRVYLDEIERALSDHPSVANSAAVVATKSAGERIVRAYVVPVGKTPADVDGQGLRAWLGERLPAYMLPAEFIGVAALPRAPDGTIDRSGLESSAEPLAPSPVAYHSPTEERLAEMLGKLLGIEEVPRDADVFSLGLHSLLAVRFAAEVQASFGVQIKLRALFEQPSIASIAKHVESLPGRGEEPVEHGPITTLSADGSRPPLTFLHGDLFDEGLYSHRLAAFLGPEQPVHLVAPHGTAGLPLVPTVEDMAQDYVRRLRAVQPHGPYRLGGFCASGLVAYEVARILWSQGEVVDRVILINTSPMPPKRVPLVDRLVRRIGLERRLRPRFRDRFCYHVARLHAAAAMGPLSVAAVLGRVARSLVVRSKTSTAFGEPPPFEARRSARDAENSLVHVVAAFTYHPQVFGGRLTLIWSEDQDTVFKDHTMGWAAVGVFVDVVSISGGHVAAISDRIGELARVLDEALGR